MDKTSGVVRKSCQDRGRTPPMSEHDYAVFSVKELKSELKRRKLTVKGLKADLIDRLLESDKCNDVSDETTKLNGTNSTQHHHHHHHHSVKALEQQREMERKERQKIVLWRKPFVTLQYFFFELVYTLQMYWQRMLLHRKSCTVFILTTSILILIYIMPGQHQKGPHIAQVTLAAWECESLDFPEPPYPNEILCPEDGHQTTVSLLTIMSKVRLEAFMWGAGTAIGELPPYFMARAARLSGVELDDEDLEEVEKLEELASVKELDLWTKIKKTIFDLVQRMGFFGILVCASIPNPLFDLAGITCGHCLIPFWTFFGATLIGKAIIKMHLQKTFVILSFSKSYVETVLQLAGDIPLIGPYIQSPFKKALDTQRNSLHRKPGQELGVKKTSTLAWIFEKVVMAMIAYFILSIINSMAQSYDKRLCEAKRRAPRTVVKIK